MFRVSRLFMMMLWYGLMMTVPCLAKQPRIIGGDPVGDDRYPYFALLRISYTQSGNQRVAQCGGTLITSQTILVRYSSRTKHERNATH
jgi:secreted trypsin-like serine protease